MKIGGKLKRYNQLPVKNILRLMFVFLMYAPSLSAQPVLVGLSSSTPPYVVPHHKNGIVLDIVRQSLAVKGHEAVFTFAPNLRLAYDIEHKKIDAGFDVPDADGVYFSETVILYKDVAVSLKQNSFSIQSTDDLSKLSVLSFQNSTESLGHEFEKMAESNPRYRESNHQSNQIAMLFLERTDVIIIEERVFSYYLLNPLPALQSLYQVSGYTIHPIFPSHPQHLAFVDEQLRNDFNAGLKQIKGNGIYAEIINRYGLTDNYQF